MIQHILLFRFNEEMPKERRDDIFRKFEICRNKLKGFIDLQHGENLSSKQQLSGGFNYGAIMTFENIDAISEYNKMKEHYEAQALQKPFLEEVLVFDI
jgi:hypothetical protein